MQNKNICWKSRFLNVYCIPQNKWDINVHFKFAIQIFFAVFLSKNYDDSSTRCSEKHTSGKNHANIKI